LCAAASQGRRIILQVGVILSEAKDPPGNRRQLALETADGVE
jgi:hypothetical protein